MRFLPTPRDIMAVVRAVRDDVATRTEDRQVPWSEESLRGDLVLGTAGQAAVASGEPALGATTAAAPSRPPPAAPSRVETEPERLEQECLEGRFVSCFDIGWKYENVRDVIRDDARAVQFYNRACGGGDMRACTNLGFMYEDGRGVTRDDARAVQLYNQGCNGGDMNGRNGLGIMFDRGEAVDQDHARAMELYRRACALGLQTTCDWLRTHQ